MQLRSLQDVFTHELKDMHNAEKQILQALPEIAAAVESPELKAALEEHQRVTEGQVDRLEQIFQAMDESPGGTKCKGMEGILKEGGELLQEDSENGALDAAIIGAAQKVEHYEIAGYGTLVAFARRLGNEDAAKLLAESLMEEKEANLKLSEIAFTVNDAAGTGDAASTWKKKRR